MIGACKYRIVGAAIVRFARPCCQRRGYLKGPQRSPFLHIYPFIQIRMEIVPLKESRKFGIIVYVHLMGSAVPAIQRFSMFSGAADGYRGLSGGGSIDLIC